MSRIILNMEGGLVRSVENLPAGWTLEVRDYEIEHLDDAEDEDFQTDEYGDKYSASLWESEHQDYDWDSEHEDWPREDWQYEVQNGDTRLGYNEWVAHNRESEESEKDCTADA